MMQENQRIRLSKKLLQTALTELLFERSIHKISVREICDKANINRTTFYKYYGSQYDLLSDMENELLGQIAERLNIPAQEARNVIILTQLLQYVNENLALCQILLNNNVDPQFPEKLLSLPQIKQVVAANMQTAKNDANLEYMFSLIVNGSYSVIKDWINKENREPPEEIALFLINTIAGLFG